MTSPRVRPPLVEDPTDLELLDGCHVAAWTQPRAEMPPLTRVFSGDRTHIWPGDPDDVADFLALNGFRFAFQEPDGGRETIVVVIEGPKGTKITAKPSPVDDA